MQILHNVYFVDFQKNPQFRKFHNFHNYHRISRLNITLQNKYNLHTISIAKHALLECVIAGYKICTCGWMSYCYLRILESRHVFHKFHNFTIFAINCGIMQKLWNCHRYFMSIGWRSILGEQPNVLFGMKCCAGSHGTFPPQM